MDLTPLKLYRMSRPPAKKRCHTNEEDIREFKEYWTEKFGMIKKDNKALCILCSESVVCRTSSVKRHFETVHKNLSNVTEQERRELISREMIKTKKQSDVLMKFISGRPSSNLVAAGFEVSKVIAQHGKPLSDGEYIKEAWLECAPFLFDNLSEKDKIIQRIKDLSVSRKTIEDRILKMEMNTTDQLTKDLASCKFFSICVDESTDITSSARLAIFSRFCRDDEVCEEMINLVTLPERTTGADICKAVVNELSIRQIDISKVVSVTTDGAPSMIGKEAGFVNLFAKHVGHPLIGFHCIIHEEALCAKAGLRELQEVMQTVTKVVNYISARALNKRQFRNLLNEVDSVYKGLTMYNNVRWLSRGFVLKRFVECMDEINLFLINQQMSYKEMSDIVWVCKLMFFADLCEHLNDLNVKLQGSGKTLDVMFDYIKAFEMKLGVFKRDVDSERFRYFPNLKKYINDLTKDDKTDCQCLQKLFVNIIESTVEQFSTRFARFRELEETAKFIKFPDSIKLDELNLQKFSWIDMDDFEMQLIEFQTSSIWRQKFVELRADLESIEKDRLEKGVRERNAENEVLMTWNTIPETFVCLKKLATTLLSIFSSTYSCESLFSVMNSVKSHNRSSLTDETSSA
ncbi:general transcription factor II-I repeat domain-containing protein 2A-like isoform X1 [Homarus americanus]|uniref:general transcription factor II-I repeat domain-containing protein 2A-like isoform X1 n=2 Tax=Homarus americanus TaxID=6706 RepID=UPI001C4831CC|nr:general transcription factor II-I repeat domain-containing protein 2A-like isoform X1 [Homarus americanus]